MNLKFHYTHTKTSEKIDDTSETEETKNTYPINVAYFNGDI